MRSSQSPGVYLAVEPVGSNVRQYGHLLNSATRDARDTPRHSQLLLLPHSPTLPGSTGERLCNATVSVCLSRRLTAVATCSWFAIDRYLPPAPELSSGQRQCCDPRKTDADLYGTMSSYCIPRVTSAVCKHQNG